MTRIHTPNPTSFVRSPRHRFRLVSLFILTSMFLTTSHALAVPTVIFDPIVSSRATGVKGLEIDAMAFDVEFVDGSYRDVYGDKGAFFMNNPTMAYLASQALVNILLKERVQFFPGYAVGFNSNSIATPYSASPDHVHGYAASFSPFWQARSYRAYCPPAHIDCWDRNTTSFGFARYTKLHAAAPVPEPSSMLFLASGIVGLSIWRYTLRQRGVAKL